MNPAKSECKCLRKQSAGLTKAGPTPGAVAAWLTYLPVAAGTAAPVASRAPCGIHRVHTDGRIEYVGVQPKFRLEDF